MAITFKLPELGENITGGTVAAIRVAVGDTVAKDQTLLELETDKAVVEVPAPAAGVIKEMKWAEGATINVGDVVAVIDDAGAASAEAPATKKAVEAPKKAAPKAEPTPKAAATPKKAVAPPAAAKEPEPEEKPAPEEEVEQAREEQGAVSEGDFGTVEDVVAAGIETPKPEPPLAGEGKPKRIAASPSTRRFAREIGIDIAQVSPTQPHGRLTQDDIKGYSKRRNTGGVSAPSAKPGAIPAAALPNFERYGTIRREKMSKVREKTAERMAIAWATIPAVTQHDKADVTKFEEFRKQYSKRAEQAGGKLTATAILVKVLGAALKEFPEFNASIDLANQEIVYKEYYNIGVAVDTPRGLLVPVIKDVNRKNIIELSVELNETAARARDAKTKLEELSGACMTVTNLGGIGGIGFTPIVNSPEVAILGVSRSRTEPVWIDGKFEPRLMMPISLSYDHRLIDGANAARFARWICEAVENPFLILLEG